MILNVSLKRGVFLREIFPQLMFLFNIYVSRSLIIITFIIISIELASYSSSSSLWLKVGDRRLPFGLQWVGGSDWVILHKYYFDDKNYHHDEDYFGGYDGNHCDADALKEVCALLGLQRRCNGKVETNIELLV